jgi:hypothetical protein
LRRPDHHQLRRGSSHFHLQLQRRARRQGLRQLRGDDDVADLERDETVRRLADDQRLEHLPRLEQRSRRGGCHGVGRLRLDRQGHRATLPDSG